MVFNTFVVCCAVSVQFRYIPFVLLRPSLACAVGHAAAFAVNAVLGRVYGSTARKLFILHQPIHAEHEAGHASNTVL